MLHIYIYDISHLRVKGLFCVEACSERACKTDAPVGNGDQACLSAASLSLVWETAIMSPADIIGNSTAITQTLQVATEQFTSSVEQAWANS